MIILYKGRKGSGKTLSMVKDAYNYYCDGWKVFSNMESVKFATYVPSDEIVAIDKNTVMSNCVLLIDEFQVMFDSRSSASNQNKKFSNFIQQIRKRDIIMLTTTQFANTVDLRLRQNLDVVVSVKFDKELEVCEGYYLDITSIEDMEEPDTFEVVFDAKEVFPLYNTKERI